MDNVELASHLDYANHHPHATTADIKYICDQVTLNGFNAAFMYPVWVPYCRQTLQYPGKIGTIVSFPLGQDSLEVKIVSAKQYASWGANELDTVLNISQIKEAKWNAVLYEMQTFVSMVKAEYPQVIIKFIPECGFLTPDEIKYTAQLMVQAKVDFFKTCSGMGPRGANTEDVRLVKEAVGDAILIKCAGGIDNREQAETLLASGAVRLGTSHALDIIGAAQSNPIPTTPALNE
jgi:deoxyribose-phosphate aldolase